jgi:hypothetical protein
LSTEIGSKKPTYKYFRSQPEKRIARYQLLRRLRKEWKCWPTVEVAKASGYSQNYIAFLRRQFGLQVVHEEAIFDPVYRAWHDEKERKRLRGIHNFYHKN